MTLLERQTTSDDVRRDHQRDDEGDQPRPPVGVPTDTDRSALEPTALDLRERIQAFGERIEDRPFLHALSTSDGIVIDLNENRVDAVEKAAQTGVEDEPADRSDTDSGRSEPRRRPIRGIQLRRVRIRSVVKVSLVFFVVAYGSLLGTAVVLWNAAQRLGFVGSVESSFNSALGTDTFALAGGTLFDVVAIGIGALCILGLIVSILLALVYNVTGMLFGGLAFEATPFNPGRRRVSAST